MLKSHSKKKKKKTEQEYQNSKQQETLGIYRSELGNICFQNDMAYEDFKVFQEEQHLTKNYVMRHLKLLVQIH